MISQEKKTNSSNEALLLQTESQLPVQHGSHLLDVLPIGNRIVLMYQHQLVLYCLHSNQTLLRQSFPILTPFESCALNSQLFALYFSQQLRVCIIQASTLQVKTSIIHQTLAPDSKDSAVHHLFSFEQVPQFCFTRRQYVTSNAYYFDKEANLVKEVSLNGLGLKFDEHGRITSYVQNCRERIELYVYSVSGETTRYSFPNPIDRNVMVAYVKALNPQEFVVAVNDSEAPPAGDWQRSSWMIGNYSEQLLRVVKSSHCCMVRVLSQTHREMFVIENELSIDCNRQFLVIISRDDFRQVNRTPVCQGLMWNIKDLPGGGGIISYDQASGIDSEQKSTLRLVKLVKRSKLAMHLLHEIGVASSYGEGILHPIIRLI